MMNKICEEQTLTGYHSKDMITVYDGHDVAMRWSVRDWLLLTRRVAVPPCGLTWEGVAGSKAMRAHRTESTSSRLIRDGRADEAEYFVGLAERAAARHGGA